MSSANENSNRKMAIREQTNSCATNNMEGEGRRRPVTYLDAEDLLMGEINEWRREQADEMRGDKLMVLLRTWEQHGAAPACHPESHAESGGERRRAGAEPQESESEVQKIEKSEGWATTNNNPCPAPSSSAGERREDGKTEGKEEEEEDEEKAKAEWEVGLARLEGKMSSMVLCGAESEGKRAKRDKKNESEAAAAESNADGADEAVQACDAGSVHEREESDGKQVRAGMKQLLQRTHVARELVRTEEAYVDFLSKGLVAVRLFPPLRQ